MLTKKEGLDARQKLDAPLHEDKSISLKDHFADNKMMDEIRNTALSARLARKKTASKTASGTARDQALLLSAAHLRTQVEDLLAANQADCAEAESAGLRLALLDRLVLDRERIESIAIGLEAVAALPDPLSAPAAIWERPNGLMIERRPVPDRGDRGDLRVSPLSHCRGRSPMPQGRE